MYCSRAPMLTIHAGDHRTDRQGGAGKPTIVTRFQAIKLASNDIFPADSDP